MSGPFPSAWQSGLDASREARRAERLRDEAARLNQYKITQNDSHVAMWRLHTDFLAGRGKEAPISDATFGAKIPPLSSVVTSTESNSHGR